MYSKQCKSRIQIIKEQYDSFLNSFYPVAHHRQLQIDKHKHIFEVGIILSSLSKESDQSVLDFGCGAGVNVALLSGILDIKCTVIDRFDEFRDENNRTAGNISEVVSRLESIGIKVYIGSYLDKDLGGNINNSFDVVCSFDVIEHLTELPKNYTKFLYSLKKEAGFLILGTPNQQHFVNRIKSLLGENTWEDFDIWMDCEQYYGHVRELLPSELKHIGQSLVDKSRKEEVVIYSSNYPMRYRMPTLGPMLDIFISKFVNLSYYLAVKIP